jgi:hypothetical protein
MTLGASERSVMTRPIDGCILKELITSVRKGSESMFRTDMVVS